MKREIEGLKAAGIGIYIVAMCAAGIAVIAWLPRIAQYLYPPLSSLSACAAGVELLLLLPMGLLKRRRSLAGSLICFCSIPHGATLFLFSVLTAYGIWGYGGLVAGLLSAGIGLVPVAFAAALTRHLWHQVFDIIILAVLVLGSRVGGAYLASAAQPGSE